jgi:osmotically-inducible protein OsmY
VEYGSAILEQEATGHRANGLDLNERVGQACAALEKTGHGWLRRVVVLAEAEVIVLRGKVPSFYLKQMAQVTVMAVPGIELVRNELEVEGGSR